MKLFLDDERFPPGDAADWVIARDCVEAREIADANPGGIRFVSFDHDLGEGKETGKDFANWLVERDLDQPGFIPSDFSFYVHSQNPVGRDNINNLLERYLETKNSTELSDERIDKIHEEGEAAALSAWGPKGSSATNPHPAGSQESDIWSYAFRNAYARDNDR